MTALRRLFIVLVFYGHQDHTTALPLRKPGPWLEPDIQGLAEFFPRCYVNVVTASEDEHVGLLQFPHVLSAPWVDSLNITRLREAEKNVFLLRSQVFNCHLLIIVGIQNAFQLTSDTAALIALQDGQSTRTLNYNLNPTYTITLVQENFRKHGWTGVKYVHGCDGQQYCDFYENKFPPLPTGMQFSLFFNAVSDSFKVTTARFACPHCTPNRKELLCQSAEAVVCFSSTLIEYHRVVDGGRKAVWATAERAYQRCTSTPCVYNPFFGRTLRGEKSLTVIHSMKFGAVLHATRLLNATIEQMPRVWDTEGNVDLSHCNGPPLIYWKAVDSSYRIFFIELRSTILSPVELYPSVTDYTLETSLSVISSHGIEPVSQSWSQYLLPFDLTLWVSTASALISIAGVTSIFVYASQKSLHSSVLAYLSTTHWLLSAFLDQVDTPMPHITASSKVLNSPVTIVFALTLPCIIMVNYMYKAGLSLSYVTGTEYERRWDDLSDVQNLTLFMALDRSSWFIDCPTRSRRWFCWSPEGYNFTDSSGGGIETCSADYKKVVNGAYCTVFLTFHSLFALPWPGTCKKIAETAYDVGNPHWARKYFPGCPSEYVKLLFNIRAHAQVFPANQLDTVIVEELTKPKTALVTTKAHLPTIWPAFQRAMRQNRSLVFKNNYDLSSDESLPAHLDGIVVGSRMNRSFTELVSREVQSLFSYGLWEFWRVQESRRLGRLGSAGKGNRADDEFQSLTMEHEEMRTPFVVLGVLLVISGLLFVANFIFRST